MPRTRRSILEELEARSLGPPEDPDRFEDFEECVETLMDDEELSREEAERICGAWETQQDEQDMTDHDDVQHRAHHQPDPERVELREEAADDGTFTVRMPLASTGEVRNEGDEPLARDEIDGMAQQIEERSVGVFLDHGSNMDIGGSRYSAVGKVGEWAAPEVEARDGAADELIADARLMDPETLPAATGPVREALATLKSQVERDIPLSSSIGWREDEDFPGGNDLMEGSIVGIPADPRTTSQDAPTAVAARALAAEDAETFERRLEELRAVVMGPDASHATTEGDMPDNDNDTDESDEQSSDADEQRDEQPEWVADFRELLEDIHSAVREDDEDDDEEDDEDDDEEDNESGADEPEETQSLEVDGDEVTAEDVRELREQLEDADPATPDDEQSADDDDTDSATTNSSDPLAKYGMEGV